MKIAIIDPAAGAAGDMFLGALVDLGVDEDSVLSLPGLLGLKKVTPRISRVQRCSIAASKVEFDIEGRGGDDRAHRREDGHHGHHLSEIIARIRGAGLSETVEARAISAFRMLAEAEGRVHGVGPEEVHLHEVGMADALLDIVGTLIGFEELGVEQVFNLPVNTGAGWVEASHGALPLPAPATGILLEDIEVVSGVPVEGEAVTPTGAVLLRVVSEGPPPSRWTMKGTGWGAGTRDPEGYPNVLRIMLGELSREEREVELLVTDIDDIQPEYLNPLREALEGAGALEVFYWALHGKKGRVGFRMEALVPPHLAEEVVDVLFENSTTAGVRRLRATRNPVARHIETVEVGSGVEVRVKCIDRSGRLHLKAEFDDVLIAAEQLGEKPLEVARRAERLAEVAKDRSTT